MPKWNEAPGTKLEHSIVEAVPTCPALWSSLEAGTCHIGMNIPALEELERRAILQSVRETGDKLAAARMLGIGKTTLYCKLKAYKVRFVD